MSSRASNILARKNFEKTDVHSFICGITASNQVRGSDYTQLSFLEKIDRWDQFGQGRTDKMEKADLCARLYQLWIGVRIIKYYTKIQSEMIFIKPVDKYYMQQEIQQDGWVTTPQGLNIEPLIIYQENYFLSLWTLQDGINQEAITTIINYGGTAEVRSRHSGKIEFERGLFLTCPDKMTKGGTRMYVYSNNEVRSSPDGSLVWEYAGDRSARELSKRLTGSARPSGKKPPDFSEYVAAFHNRAAYPPFQQGKFKKHFVVDPVDPLDQGTGRKSGQEIIYLLSSNFLPAGNNDSEIFSEPHKYDSALREYYDTHIERDKKTNSTNSAVAHAKKSKKLWAGKEDENEFKEISAKRYKSLQQLQLGSNVQAYRQDIITCLNDNGSLREFKKIETSPAGNCLFNAVMAGLYGYDTSNPNNKKDKWAINAREKVCKYYKEGKDGRASFLEDREHSHNIAAKLQELFSLSTNQIEFDRFTEHLSNNAIDSYIDDLIGRFEENKKLSLYDELNTSIPNGNGQTYLKTLVKAYSEYMTYNENMDPSFVYGTETELLALTELYQIKICVRKNPEDTNPQGTDSDEVKEKKNKCYNECYGSGPREVFVFYENIHYTTLIEVNRGSSKSKNDNHNQGPSDSDSNSRYHGKAYTYGPSDSNSRYHGKAYTHGPSYQ